MVGYGEGVRRGLIFRGTPRGPRTVGNVHTCLLTLLSCTAVSGEYRGTSFSLRVSVRNSRALFRARSRDTNRVVRGLNGRNKFAVSVAYDKGFIGVNGYSSRRFAAITYFPSGIPDVFSYLRGSKRGSFGCKGVTCFSNVSL